MKWLDSIRHALTDTQGIYAIHNKDSGTMYIGSSAHISRRWRQHRGYLENGEHANRSLQRDWDRLGSGMFRLVVLEIVDDETQLLSREQYWLDKACKVGATYNMKQKVGDGSRRERYRIRREYGMFPPADFDMTSHYQPVTELVRGLALIILINGDWAWTEEELVTLFHGSRGNELSDDEVGALIWRLREVWGDHYRQEILRFRLENGIEEPRFIG